LFTGYATRRCQAGEDGDNTVTAHMAAADGRLPGRVSRDNIRVVNIPGGSTLVVSTPVVGAVDAAASAVLMGDAEARAEIS
jgi:hypothetical protein